MTRRVRASPSSMAWAAVLTCGLVAVAAPVWTSAATPPSSEPAGSDESTTTTESAGTYEFGVFTAPDGSFSASFGDAPGRSVDSVSGIVTYLFGLDEDSQSVVIFPATALGALDDSSPAERADRFLAASGTDIEYLANTPTNLGPFPASHFAARLTLADERPATVYGVLADRGDDVAYAFYTDIGDDDNTAATTFVQSFAIVLPEPPRPTTTVPPTTMTATTVTATTLTATTVAATTVAPTTTATPPPSTFAEAPGGALVGFDGRWRIGFPSGVTPSFRASTDDGFAYAEYLAIDGDDTLILRITEVPPGYEWSADDVPDAAADRVGGELVESRPADVDGRPGVRFRFAQDDSDTSGDTVEALVVNGRDQIYSVEFRDGGIDSPDAAAEFIDSFRLA